jgi:hypothetical protein
MHRPTTATTSKPSKLALSTSPLLFAVLLAQACAPTAAADPAGSASASEVRKTDPFRGIELAGTIEVEARIDPAARVEVFGEPDRLKQVTTSVQGGVLRIDTKGKLEKSHLRVVVTAPSLTSLSISGTGALRVSGLTGGALDVTIAGTGALQLAGKADTLRLTIPGTGDVRAKDLIVADATVDMQGTGAAKLHATRSLDARISGTGAIQVYGRPPSVKKSISGTGVVDVN